MSPRSGSGKDSTVAESVVDEGAGNVAPLVDVVLADEDQIDWDSKPSKRPTKSDELGVAISKIALDNKQIEIAIGSRVPLRMGPEQDDFGWLGCGRSQTASRCLDHILGSHGATVPRDAARPTMREEGLQFVRSPKWAAVEAAEFWHGFCHKRHIGRFWRLPGVAVGVVGTRIASGFRSDGAEGTRTPDLCHAKAALFQLSYSPRFPVGGISCYRRRHGRVGCRSMGVLDDAIREHLELKRKHGASEGEVEQQEQEALGAPRGRPAEPAEAATNGEAVQEPPPVEEPAAPQAEEPAPVERDEPEPEPIAEQPVAEPEAPVEPESDEPDWDFEPEPAEPPAEPEPESDAGGDTPPRGFERVEDVEPPAADDDEEDVLEETPDFLQETPEHDRLWFEQKPPRDFDFDDDK